MTTGFVRVDDSELRRLLRDAPRQIPFAISKAINTVAKSAWLGLRRNVRQDGIILRRQWVVNGIRVGPIATRGNLQRSVGSLDPVMAAAAVGDERPFRGLVPLVGPGRPRASKTSVLPSRFKASGDVVEKLLNLVDPKTGTKTIFRHKDSLYQRVGSPQKRARGDATAKVRPRKPIIRVFSIPKGEVIIPKRWQYQKRIDLTLAQEWEQAVIQAVDFALSSRKAGR